MNKEAVTSAALHPLLKARWSPRAFSGRAVEPEKLESVLEAARWAPSAGNQQPWAFIVSSAAETAQHEKLVAALKGHNLAWARQAPVLMVAVAKLNPDKPALQRYAYYDLGQAVAHLTVQASALGLHVHQMAGFEAERVRQIFAIPDGAEPMTVIALGYLGDASALPPELRDRENAPRTRKALSEFVYGRAWDQPLGLAQAEPVAGD